MELKVAEGKREEHFYVQKQKVSKKFILYQKVQI